MRTRHKTRHPGIYYRLVDEAKPDGSRRYIVWYSDSNGQAHTETLPLGATLEDARLRQGELKRRRSQGETLLRTKKTVSELLDEWLDSRRSSLKPATVEAYEWGITHLKRNLGRRKVSELSPSDVARMIADLKAQGMKTWSVKKILTPLSSSLQIAVREGWISSSPMVKLLSHERPKADQKEMRCLSKDEIPKLVSSAASGRWKTLFSTLIFTRLRIGEALALSWDDIDTVNGLVHVRGGKTDAAKRDVMLITALRRLLTAWRLQQAPGSPVFPGSRREALRALRAAEKRAGLPRYTLHELRHTFASILIAQGELPTFVAHQMGHADPGVTMKVYAHLWEKEESVQRASERLQEAFGGLV